jgi:hypothetical protein
VSKTVKIPVVLAVLAAGIAVIVRKRGSSKADAALWREAIVPRQQA